MSSPPVLRRSLRVIVALVVIVSGLLTACDVATETDGDPAAPAAIGSTEPSPHTPGAPPPPMNTATPAPVAPPEDDAYGVAVVDVETGAVAVVYESAEPFFVREALGPNAFDFSRSIWLSPTTAEAIHYAPDGTVIERIEGWDVLTAPDGVVRSWIVGNPGNADASLTLVVERDGTRHEMPVEDARWRAFSPDSARLAWIAQGRLHVLDLDTGEASEVSASALPPLAWSPAGRYLAYASPTGGGVEVIAVDAGDESAPSPIAVPGELNLSDSWVVAEGEYLLLTLQNGTPVLTSVETGEEIVLPFSGAEIAWVLGDDLIAATSDFGANRLTVIFEAMTGTPVRELHGEADVVATPEGLASAVITRSELACTGIDVVHPRATRRLPCEAEHARWSPDGQLLALIPLSTTAPVEILEVATGAVRELPHPGLRGTVPRWSADGRYLVWMWMASP